MNEEEAAVVVAAVAIDDVVADIVLASTVSLPTTMLDHLVKRNLHRT